MLVHQVSPGPFVSGFWSRVLAATLVFSLLWSSRFPGLCRAQGRAEGETSVVSAADDLPRILPRTPLGDLADKPVLKILIREAGSERDRELAFSWFRSGTPLTSDLVRRMMAELLQSGRYAALSAETEAIAGGVLIRLSAVARKIVARVNVSGGVLDASRTLEQAGVSAGDELTEAEVPQLAARIWQFYKKSGFPKAQVAGRIVATDDPVRVLLVFNVTPGEPLTISRLRFQLSSHADPSLQTHLAEYAVSEAQRADEALLTEADTALQERLRRAGWFKATVSHHLVQHGEGDLVVSVTAGRLVRVRFEGQRRFDVADLRAALELDAAQDLSQAALVGRIQRFYEQRGFYEVGLKLVELKTASRVDWLIQIREHEKLRVVGRWFPCLTGSRTAGQLNQEIDGVLTEALPGGDDFLVPVSPKLIDATMGRSQPGSLRATPFEPVPWQVYTPEAYERAVTHLTDLYRSEGYLSAMVGPSVVMRRRCDPRSQAGQCAPLGQRFQPPSQCPNAQNPIPVADGAQSIQATCKPDPKRGIRCEPAVVLSIPVKLGPRTQLWDLQFEGNNRLVEADLERAAGLTLGEPVSQLQLQQARRRLLSTYADRGFAFANVDVDLELSQDHTRGRVRFIIGEREPVYVKGFRVRGANLTSRGVILGRLELAEGDLYRSHLVRDSEEQLGNLGVFSSVTIGLEDPEVPAREKTVIITVQEKPSQYLEVKPGFSTGEGARAAIEYGHRNLLGRAVQLRFRVQLGYLPSPLIFETDVRRNFDELTLGERLERSNTITLEFPIAKRFRLAVDGVDARDNSRDYGITKRAAIVTLTHRPSEQISAVLGASFELNDAGIFGETASLKDYLEANPQLVRLLNVPEGRSFAIAARGGGSWDRRDNQLGPTRGTFVSAEVEPVVAYLDDDSAAVQTEPCRDGDTRACEYTSRFIKFTSRVAGYIPINDKGLSFAVSLRWGANLQLADNSATYPDRLFFFGGGDSLRGFLQASVIPQDIADRLQPEGPSGMGDENRLTARKVVIRGGDFMINPRAELRIPLTKVLQTAIFLDTGNIWRDIKNVDPTVLRYSIGTGLRAMTPIGPLAFDYGFKLDRRFYEEDLGAFHFSVGLF